MTVSSAPLSILIVDHDVPAHDRASGALRLRRIIEALVADGHHVTFLAAAGVGREHYLQELRTLGVEAHGMDQQRLRASGYTVSGLGIDLAALLHRGRFDLAWISFYHVAESYLNDIRLHSPATRIVIDTVDVHHVRMRRGAEVTGDQAALKAAEKTREREAAIYSEADALVAVSADDARELTELAPEVPVMVVSNIHTEQPAGPGFGERSGLVFVGNFDHEPNVDAICHFHSIVWPLVRRAVPDIRLTIVGNAPPVAVEALAGAAVEVTGWVPDTAPYLHAARVSIAPLRYGAGVKGKIGEALSFGLPVVTTPTGAEGMDLRDGEHLLVADAPAAFAAAVARLYGDAALWERLARNGRDQVAASSSPGTSLRALRAVLESVATPFVVDVDGLGRERAKQAVARYVGTFAETDPVTLALLAGQESTPEQLYQDILETVAASGLDPEEIADVHVSGSAERPALPLNAVEITDEPRADAPRTVSPDAAGAAWRDAIAAPSSVAGDGPRASIVICLHGKRDYTERCLASLDAALGERLGTEFELVLVDNASPDSTRELLRAWADRAELVLLDRNRNFAGGNNAGAAVASGRTLAFLNNDTEVPPGAIERLVAEAERPGVGGVGARLVYPDGRLQHGGFGWRPTGPSSYVPFHLFHFEAGDLPEASGTFDTSAVTGACLAVPAQLYSAVGGFDEGYVNGWEDVDLCLRLRQTGARIRYCGAVAIVHHEGITSGGDYHSGGNRQRFISKWAKELDGDGPLLERTFGGSFNPLIDVPLPGERPNGAPVVVHGPVTGFGPEAAEARGILRAIRAFGGDVAARPAAPTWVGPELDEPTMAAVRHAYRRPARPEALPLHVGERAGGPALERVSAVCEPREGVIALAPTRALADELLAAGWAEDCVVHLPPAGIDAAPGDGANGILALLPSHDEPAFIAQVEALSNFSGTGVRALLTVDTIEARRTLAERLPDAEVLPTSSDEVALGTLAGGSDVVLAAVGDPYQRVALTAACAGAAIVVEPAGPAADVLGDQAAVAERADAGALTSAIRAALDGSAGRAGRRAAVVAASAAGMDALRSVLDPGAPDPRRADWAASAV